MTVIFYFCYIYMSIFIAVFGDICVRFTSCVAPFHAWQCIVLSPHCTLFYDVLCVVYLISVHVRVIPKKTPRTRVHS